MPSPPAKPTAAAAALGSAFGQPKKKVSGFGGLKKFKAAANVMKAVKRMSDWVKMTDPATGETFYENKKTGDLSWNDPEETPGAEVISGSATF